ncbi:hypothetical protein CXF41_03440 [Corynebacterium bovis]|nr:hypothetical protein CXF41_03440 [Corynebacterium bovis]
MTMPGRGTGPVAAGGRRGPDGGRDAARDAGRGGGHTGRWRRFRRGTPGDDGDVPVICAVGSPDLAEEVALVADATGGPVLAGLRRAGRTARVLRVGSRRPGEGAVFELPGDAAELAAAVGRREPVRVGVTGAVGGAGTSVFAAALATVLAEGAEDPPVLVDGDPRPPGLDVVLGVEDAPGWRLPELVGAGAGVRPVVLDGETVEQLPLFGGVRVLADPGGAGAPGRGPVVDAATLRGAVVTDRGGGCGGSGGCGCDGGDRTTVLVVPATVAAVYAVRHRLGAMPADTLVVLREVPGATLSSPDAALLLGRHPEVWWGFDALLPAVLDDGVWEPAASSAGQAARELVDHVAGWGR